ncbi:hypothetical protein GQ54DRAFT_116556 [Martensiomyces pterosporus]|nr:hypothetical protein GQ54DRAFT_116556 [Martensiomyces pterosporus]
MGSGRGWVLTTSHHLARALRIKRRPFSGARDPWRVPKRVRPSAGTVWCRPEGHMNGASVCVGGWCWGRVRIDLVGNPSETASNFASLASMCLAHGNSFRRCNRSGLHRTLGMQASGTQASASGLCLSSPTRSSSGGLSGKHMKQGAKRPARG